MHLPSSDRVGQGSCGPFPPTEPCLIISHHTAQALQKVPLWGFPQAIFRLLHDTNRQSVWSKPEGAPARRPSFAFLHYTDSLCTLVMKHQPEVSLLTEPRMFHSVSPPLQQGLRFLRHLDPNLQQLALRLACPEGEGLGVPRSA